MRIETIEKIARVAREQQQYYPTLGQWRAMVHELADIVQADFLGWPCKQEFLHFVNSGIQDKHTRA